MSRSRPSSRATSGIPVSTTSTGTSRRRNGSSPRRCRANRLRLQRILFLSDLAGNIREDTIIRHQSEDWEYDAASLYDFVAPLTWQARDLRATPGLWTRRVTNLDDGLRYQCAARWSEDRAYPEWSCANYAPIPGRETRDMGRSDYQTLQRGTRVMVYGAAQGGSWLERQDNVKTIHNDTGRVPLVRELGKNWYVRLPDAECAGARAFADQRRRLLDSAPGDVGRRARRLRPLRRARAGGPASALRQDVRGRGRRDRPEPRRPRGAPGGPASASSG